MRKKIGSILKIILAVLFLGLVKSISKIDFTKLLEAIILYPIYFILALPMCFFYVLSGFRYITEITNILYVSVYWILFVIILFLLLKRNKNILKIFLFLFLAISHIQVFYIIQVLSFF